MVRHIYWGLVLTFTGICSYIILCLVARFFWTREMDGFQIVTMPPALTYITMFTIYFSLPLAIAIEAYLFLKGRKGEVKGNEYVVSAIIILITIPIIATILGIEEISQFSIYIDIFAIILLVIIVFLRPLDEELQHLAPI